MNHTITGLEAEHGLPAPACDPWKFWGTAGWGVLAFGAWLLAQMIVAVAAVAWLDVGTDARQILNHGLAFSVVVVAAAPAFLAVIVLAVRMAGARTDDYLALHRPRRNDLLLGLACIAILIPLGDLVTWLSGRDIVHPFMVDAYVTAREAGAVGVFALAGAIVLAAPLTEEIGFRGFLYRGWAASPLGPTGAIVLTSAIWAVMHIQYEPFYIVHIFLLGLVFGWLRWRSGSTLLTILLHFLVNATALLETALVLAWRS
jgi:membrane protease YdiL (CAAX protease family)